ncbi:MAG: peptide ABC transporter substrate-binding protein, partial [Planctomycetota bacterium]|nr:peptide ABC transporter substrate-binding protein [Planctomycetota bacterium]
WSNGDPVTAEDFVFSFRRFLDPETASKYAYQLWYVRGARAFTEGKGPWEDVGIRKTASHTLELELESPTPFFLDLVGFYPLFPVNRRNIEEAKADYPDDWELKWLQPDRLVTNGPYRVASRRVNDRIRLVKNETYWDADNVAFDTIDVTAIEKESTMLNFYLTGQASYIDRVSTNVVQELLPREDFTPAPYLGSYFYRVNVTKPPFDDKRVRRALWLTIPRETICVKIEKKGEVPADSLVPPMSGYTKAVAAAGSADEARALMAEAGFGPGGKSMPTLEIHYNTSDAHRDIAEVIAESWNKELGINAKLLNQEWKVYLDTQNNLGYDVSRSAWIGDYSDPNTFLDMFVTGGGNNKTGYSNPEYDQLIADAARELDMQKRAVILQRAEEILMDELPILPIYYYVTKNVVDARLGGFFENVQDEHFPKFWYWMDDEELAAKRAQYPDDGRHEHVRSHGPPEGKYSPNQLRERKNR